jgi:hypothetical protein
MEIHSRAESQELLSIPFGGMRSPVHGLTVAPELYTWQRLNQHEDTGADAVREFASRDAKIGSDGLWRCQAYFAADFVEWFTIDTDGEVKEVYFERRTNLNCNETKFRIDFTPEASGQYLMSPTHDFVPASACMARVDFVARVAAATYVRFRPSLLFVMPELFDMMIPAYNLMSSAPIIGVPCEHGKRRKEICRDCWWAKKVVKPAVTWQPLRVGVSTWICHAPDAPFDPTALFVCNTAT